MTTYYIYSIYYVSNILYTLKFLYEWPDYTTQCQSQCVRWKKQIFPASWFSWMSAPAGLSGSSSRGRPSPRLPRSSVLILLMSLCLAEAGGARASASWLFPARWICPGAEVRRYARWQEAGCSPGSAAVSAIKPWCGLILAVDRSDLVSLMWKCLGQHEPCKADRWLVTRCGGGGGGRIDPNIDHSSTNLGIAMDSYQWSVLYIYIYWLLYLNNNRVGHWGYKTCNFFYIHLIHWLKWQQYLIECNLPTLDADCCSVVREALNGVDRYFLFAE